MYILLAALTVALGGTWFHWDYWRCRYTRQAIRAVQRADTDKEILACPSPYRNWDIGNYEVLWYRLKRANKARAKFHAAQQRRHRAAFKQLDKPYDRLEKILEGEGGSNDNFVEAYGMTEQQVVEQFQADADATYALIRSGDRVAMHAFDGLMEKYRYAMSRFCEQHGISSLRYPAEWDDLVVQFDPFPTAKDFKHLQGVTVGNIGQLAAEALRKRNLKLAKIVLAYCAVEEQVYGEEGSAYGYSYSHRTGRSKQVIYPYLMQVGELASQLHIMVEELFGTSPYGYLLTQSA